jgi:hypothetical protein
VEGGSGDHQNFRVTRVDVEQLGVSKRKKTSAKTVHLSRKTQRARGGGVRSKIFDKTKTALKATYINGTINRVISITLMTAGALTVRYRRVHT